MVYKETKIVAIIQARIGSKRLPRKILKKIGNRTIFEWIYYRLMFCNKLDQIVLSTSDSIENKVLIDIAQKHGLKHYAGSEIDLVDRMYKTAKKFNASAIVRITGDCPLVDPFIVDSLILKYLSKQPIDYASNSFPPTFPDGMDVEIISFKTLERLFNEVKDPLYREWITITIMKNPEKFKIFNMTQNTDMSNFRLTVDYSEDFELIKKIINSMHEEGNIFYLSDIIKFLKENPELILINKNRVDSIVINNIRSKSFADAKNI